MSATRMSPFQIPPCTQDMIEEYAWTDGLWDRIDVVSTGLSQKLGDIRPLLQTKLLIS